MMRNMEHALLQGVHHVCLKAQGSRDYERAREFYLEILGFRLVREWGEGDDRGCMIQLGNCLLELMANGKPEQNTQGIYRHIAFRTENADSAFALAVSAGCPVVMEPCDRNLGGRYPIRIAFCTGPLGEELEFFQEKTEIGHLF